VHTFQRGPDQGFPSGSVRLVPNPGTVPMMADGSLLRSGGETWGPVSPDNVHETGVSPGGQSRSAHRGPRGRTGRANSKKDLFTGPDPRFCALQAALSGTKSGDSLLSESDRVSGPFRLGVPATEMGDVPTT
jgi:hypothetical protein